ncbi:50S ribosomal protein L18 [Candidatus Microgenomates bacterium]|nr:50S ribosomal protein L18 [Candidatus Microgenomates bacterium]
MDRKYLLSKKRRQNRVRAKIRAQSDRIRLSVFRSNRYIYGQLIDDARGETLASVNKKDGVEAKTLGLLLATRALKKKITKVVFDRGRYAYHGKVKAFAQGAREGGLIF